MASQQSKEKHCVEGQHKIRASAARKKRAGRECKPAPFIGSRPRQVSLPMIAYVATAFPGLGTLINVATVIVGSSIGLLLGARLPTRTRDTVTDALGLVTLLIGALSAAEVGSRALAAAVGSAAPVLIVLGALLLGGIAGSLLDIEARLRALATGSGRGSRADALPYGYHAPEQAQARTAPVGTRSRRSAAHRKPQPPTSPQGFRLIQQHARRTPASASLKGLSLLR